MIKNEALRKLIGKILFVGLLINTLPATLPLKAQLPKLSQEEVKDEIRKIKKEVRKLTIATFVIPPLIIAVGSIVFLLAYGLAWKFGKTRRKKPAKIIEEWVKRARDITKRIKRIEKFKQVSHISAEWIQRQKSVRAKTIKDLEKKLALISGKAHKRALKVLKKANRRQNKSILVALAMLLTPIAASLAFLGLAGETFVEAYDSAERLERMEKEHPGTLTNKQKIVVARLKKLYRDPLSVGINKYFAMKSALKKAANRALQTQGKLVKKIGLKKARTKASSYIKAKLEVEGLQISVNEMKKQFTAQKLKTNKIYKKAHKRLKKMQNNITDLEREFPSLKNVKQSIIDGYGVKVTNILETFENHALKLEKEEPEIDIVPL